MKTPNNVKRVNDTNNVTQQIEERSHYQSHSKNLNGDSVPTRGQEVLEVKEVIEVIEFIAQTMTTLTNNAEKLKKAANLKLVPAGIVINLSQHSF